jgi:predicted transcriptional regulator
VTKLAIGDKLPEFEIIKEGVATENGKFVAWGSDELFGLPAYLVANGGHASANDMHQSTSTKIAEGGKIKMCRIINAKDAPLGAGMFIKREFKKGGSEDPANFYVMDGKGIVSDELGIEKKSAVTLITDADGTIRFVKYGQLNAADESDILSLVEAIA